MGLAISLIVTIMEILNGFLDTDKEKIKMAQTFNCSKWQLLTKIVIPANISTFINSLKINIRWSLVGVITGEFLVSKAGLGYLIVYGGQVFQLDLVMTGVIILAAVATVLYGSVILLEKLLYRTHKFGWLKSAHSVGYDVLLNLSILGTLGGLEAKTSKA